MAMVGVEGDTITVLSTAESQREADHGRRGTQRGVSLGLLRLYGSGPASQMYMSMLQLVLFLEGVQRLVDSLR